MITRPKPVVMLVALVLWIAAAALAAAAPGALDGSFGVGGTSLVNLGGKDVANAVALQPDGSIVVAGSTKVGTTYDQIVARLRNPSGTLDPSYGGGAGWSRLDLGGDEAATALALEPGGRIVVVGYTGDSMGKSATVARLLNPQGTFDTSFGSGFGWSILPFGGLSYAGSLALQPDGQILLGGYDTPAGGANSDATVGRVQNPKGLFDPAFASGNGWSRLDGGFSEEANAIALQPDGRIVAAGDTTANGGDVFVARLLNPQGAFDPNFGATGSGRAVINLGGVDSGYAMALQPDGKIVISGQSTAGGSYNLFVLRLSANGALDPSFGSGGKVFVDFGGDERGGVLALQPDGKIIVAGSKSGGGGAADVVVARLQPNGLLDTTFGSGGRSVVDFGGEDLPGGVALQPDGRIVIAGSSRSASWTRGRFARQLHTNLRLGTLNRPPRGSGGRGAKMAGCAAAADTRSSSKASRGRRPPTEASSPSIAPRPRRARTPAWSDRASR